MKRSTVAPAAKRVAAVDAVAFQVIQSRLSGIVQEMQNNVFRTGYSTVIRESQDASCMILTELVGRVAHQGVRRSRLHLPF